MGAPHCIIQKDCFHTLYGQDSATWKHTMGCSFTTSIYTKHGPPKYPECYTHLIHNYKRRPYIYIYIYICVYIYIHIYHMGILFWVLWRHTHLNTDSHGSEIRPNQVWTSSFRRSCSRRRLETGCSSRKTPPQATTSINISASLQGSSVFTGSGMKWVYILYTHIYMLLFKPPPRTQKVG